MRLMSSSNEYVTSIGAMPGLPGLADDSTGSVQATLSTATDAPPARALTGARALSKSGPAAGVDGVQQRLRTVVVHVVVRKRHGVHAHRPHAVNDVRVRAQVGPLRD